jgi:hypothetical protein
MKKRKVNKEESIGKKWKIWRTGEKQIGRGRG